MNTANVSAALEKMVQVTGSGLKLAAQGVKSLYDDAGERALEAQRQAMIQQIYNNASMYYFDIAAIVLEVISANKGLGLLLPGIPEQIMLNNGICVNRRGIPFYFFCVRKSRKAIQSTTFSDIQDALDAVCYRNGFYRLRLVRIFPRGEYYGLCITWGRW